MKIFNRFFIVLIAIIGFIACGSPDNNDNKKTEWSSNGSPIGEWELAQWNDSKDLPLGVYLRLNEDNTFDIYQHTYTVLWVHYSGTFSLEGTTLRGTYSDGESWGGDYTIEYSLEEPKKIRLTRINNSGNKDVGIYVETTIPTEIQEDATEAINVRSVAVERFF